MKITLTCGRKFHSDHLGAALLARDSLERVITANPPFAYKRYKFPNAKLIHTIPYYLPGMVASRFGVLENTANWLNWKASRQFDRTASRQLGNPDAVISWAWSALETLTTAKQRGISAILEECGSANAHQDSLLREEYERLNIPGYIGALPEIIENEKNECKVADFILCPSDYVAESFSVYGIPKSRCIVIPYASNPKFRATHPKFAPKKIKILYVGSVGARKGIIYLLQALKKLPAGSYECTVIGQVESAFEKTFAPYRSKVRHICSVPHDEMPRYFQDASVFVLPTLDEGMAYVTMEALASATPVITTANSGAVGKVIHKKNGFIVPLRDPYAIAHSLTCLLDNPELYESMSEIALREATSWSWDDYTKKLTQQISPQ